MPQDSHPFESKRNHVEVELESELGDTPPHGRPSTYHHLQEEDYLSSSGGMTPNAESPVNLSSMSKKLLALPLGATGIPLGRVPFSDNRETSAREEWLRFMKEHEESHQKELREFQRNLPRKFAHFVRESVLRTTEMFVTITFMLFFVSCFVANHFVSVRLGGAYLHRWALFCGILVWGFIFAKFCARRLIKLSKRFRIFETYVYYFIHSSYHTLSVLIVASVALPFWRLLVPSIKDDTDLVKYFNLTFVVVILLSATNLVRAVGTKLLTGMANKSHFHSQIVTALFNERMLVNLLMPSKNVHPLPNKKKAFSMKELLGDMELRKFHSMSRLVQRRSLAALNNELSRMDEINSTEKARELAQRVFNNIDRTNKGYITKQDIEQFVKPKYTNKVFSVFDVDGDGKVVKMEVEELVIRIYRERNALSNGLKDSENMGLVLTKIVTFVFWFVMLFVTLRIYGFPILNLVTPMAAFFVGFGFIFGETLREVFSSIILIFIIHPFDVGDRVSLDKGQTIMTVESIHLLTTHFYTLEGKYVIMKNATLGSHPMHNYKRSRIANHKFEIQIAFGTPMEKIVELRRSITSYLSEYPKLWKPDLYFWITDIANTNRVNIQFWCTTRFTWQEGPSNWNARTDLYFFVRRKMLESSITYFSPPQPVTLSSPSTEDRDYLSQLCVP